MGRKRFNCGQRVSCSPRQKVAAGGINALGKVHTAVLLNCFLAHFGEEERDGRTRIILWRAPPWATPTRRFKGRSRYINLGPGRPAGPTGSSPTSKHQRNSFSVDRVYIVVFFRGGACSDN